MATPLSPKVASTRAEVLRLISAMSEGESLPPERELAARWQVSRMTLRRAMDDLVVSGVLDRRQGSGSVLARPRLNRRLSVSSFTEDMLRRGRVPSNRTLEFRRRSADRAVSQKLRMPMGEQYVAFTRLRLADGEPIAVESSMIAAHLVPGLTEDDLDGSWYQLLTDRYGLQVVDVHFVIEPMLPDARIAEHLRIPTTQPCLRIKVDGVDARGRVLETGESVFRGDTYSLSAESSATGGPTTTARRPRPRQPLRSA